MRSDFFYTVTDLSTMLGVTPQRIYQLLAAGHLPAVTIGGRRLVPKEAWEKWLVEQNERALAAVRGDAAVAV